MEQARRLSLQNAATVMTAVTRLCVSRVHSLFEFVWNASGEALQWNSPQPTSLMPPIRASAIRCRVLGALWVLVCGTHWSCPLPVVFSASKMLKSRRALATPANTDVREQVDATSVSQSGV